MTSPRCVYRFDGFVVDTARVRLSRDGIDAVLPDPCVAILATLLANRGQIVSKDALTDAGWGEDKFIGPNSVDRGISTLRAIIGEDRIDTVRGRGYRFAGDFTVDAAPAPPPPPDDADAALTPYRAVAEAERLIDTLECGALARGIDICRAGLAVNPTHAALHRSLATAYALIYESTRADLIPDREMLQWAVHHAREARRHDAGSAEAWSTLAFVLALDGDTADALAAARKAIELDPKNWRHSLRLAYVSWGEARRLAAYQVLQLAPGLALTHWLMATVFIARGAFAEAIGELRLGAALQDVQNREYGRFNAVGLHLLLGLALAASGCIDEALREFDRELAAAVPGQIYARECAANTWYSRGALLLRIGRAADAAEAFREALRHIPGHMLASIGLAAACGEPIPAPAAVDTVATVDVVMATIAGLACQGQAMHAASFAADVLARTPQDYTAWLLPAEPLINAVGHPECWAPALGIVAARARSL